MLSVTVNHTYIHDHRDCMANLLMTCVLSQKLSTNFTHLLLRVAVTRQLQVGEYLIRADENMLKWLYENLKCTE